MKREEEIREKLESAKENKELTQRDIDYALKVLNNEDKVYTESLQQSMWGNLSDSIEMVNRFEHEIRLLEWVLEKDNGR